MDDYTLSALNGSLASPSWLDNNFVGGASYQVQNNLPVPLYIYGVNTAGELILCWEFNDNNQPVGPLLFKPGVPTPLTLVTKAYYIVRTAFSGAFVCLLYNTTTPSGKAPPIIIGPANLVPPNLIGRHPGPNTNMPIPPDSPRVLVGVGATPTSPANVITREQFWQRMGDSYTMAPGTKRVVSTTLVSGMQNTSSHEESMSKSLGLSSSFGWGPVSASLSANLSSSSSSMQQVTISTESTQYESLELHNQSTTDTQLILRWQLVDVMTIYQTVTPPATLETPSFPPPANGPGGMTPVTTVSLGQSPVMVGSYNPASLPQPPTTPSQPTTNINVPTSSSGSVMLAGRRAYGLAPLPAGAVRSPVAGKATVKARVKAKPKAKVKPRRR